MASLSPSVHAANVSSTPVINAGCGLDSMNVR
ncbi:Uncharacterised protein [Mycobacterium tuberculosis]|nr:Uncharacterised protein [Mycobacterium tuberculosis]